MFQTHGLLFRQATNVLAFTSATTTDEEPTMRNARLVPMLMVLLAAPAAISAADLTGKWTIDGDVQGDLDGQPIQASKQG